MNILAELENFINEFNLDNNEDFNIDSIRVEFDKRYKLEHLKKLGNWNKINKNNQTILKKLKKRLILDEITNAYQLEKYNIYYYNKKDTSTNRKYRSAELVIFGMKQYHKEPPPKELISKILSILKDVTNIDVCSDFPVKPHLQEIKRLFETTPYIKDTGVVTDTLYINKPEITMIEKIIIYDKQDKNDLGFKVWRVEAKITIPNVQLLALPLYEFKEFLEPMKKHQALKLDLIKKMGAYFSIFSYNSPNNNLLNLASNFCSTHDVN